MYREHFAFKELPFSIAPDPRFLYMSEQHREAMAHLVYGMDTDGGFVLLTGEVGTGKTTICRCLLEQVREKTDIAFILNPKMTAEELLATVCDELGIGYPEGNVSIKVFVDKINTYLLDAFAAGRKTVLIIEEAQNLRPEVLEQLRLLTNLETNQQKLLKIIMIGQPELKDVLLRSDMEQLSQRITARYHIGPLSKDEVRAYVDHRLSVAGAKAGLFPDSIISALHRITRGVPRLINVVCDRALLGAYVQGKDNIDKKTLIKASHEIFGGNGLQRDKRRLLRWIAASLVLVGCGAAIATTYYSHIVSVEKTVEVPLTVATGKESDKPDMLPLASAQPIDLSREMAYQALFKEWNISYQAQGSANICRQAMAKDVRCLDGSITLKALMNLNRPAVLKLFDDKGKEFYATIKKIESQKAVLVVGGETKTVDFKEIEKRWLGDYLLLWKAPGNYKGIIRPGDRGPQIAWLESNLSSPQNKRTQPRNSFIYDADLVKRVKRFQLSEGVLPDGIVGPQTIIHLINRQGTKEPLLTAKNKGDK